MTKSKNLIVSAEELSARDHFLTLYFESSAKGSKYLDAELLLKNGTVVYRVFHNKAQRLRTSSLDRAVEFYNEIIL